MPIGTNFFVENRLELAKVLNERNSGLYVPIGTKSL